MTEVSLCSKILSIRILFIRIPWVMTVSDCMYLWKHTPYALHTRVARGWSLTWPVSKVIGQKATSPTCHPLWMQMDSSNLNPIQHIFPCIHIRQTRMATCSVQPFLQGSPFYLNLQSPTLIKGPDHTRNCPFSWVYAIHGCLAPIQTAPRSVQPFFAGLTKVTNRHTDNVTPSVATDMHLRH